MSSFSKVPVTGGAGRKQVLQPLREAEMVSTKAALPAEIISTILDYLPVRDLMQFARASKRMQEMVYDDSRWVKRLQSMGFWNEAEARKRFEYMMRRKHEVQKAKQEEEVKRVGIGVGGAQDQQWGSRGGTSTTLFDAGVEEQRQARTSSEAHRRGSLVNGIDSLAVSLDPSVAETQPIPQDPLSCLGVLDHIRSMRGFARQEYGRIYGALGPFYFDLASSKSHKDPVVFRAYRDPDQQAKMLAQLKIFARSDWAQGWHRREEKLNLMMGVFENAVLREFESGYEFGDTDGQMKRYAHVLVTLNGGQAGIELFIQKHPLMSERDKLGNPMECLDDAPIGGISLGPSHDFFSRLSSAINEQADVIDRVFPMSVNVMLPFLERIGEDIISEYVTPLFDEARSRNLESYLKAVTGIFEQSLQFALSLKPTKASGSDFVGDVHQILANVFEQHLDLYLQDELEFFRKQSDTEVNSWEKQLFELEASTESFFMSNVNRQADKRDFLTSFKKVVMMPVNALPSIPISSPFSSAKPTVTGEAVADGEHGQPQRASLQVPARSSTPVVLDGNPLRTPTPQHEAPTTELAAQAAIMNSRLEGIRSLFSIEVALNLVHGAKASLERAAVFVRLGGQSGEEAREQCEAIFVLLLEILGSRHIRPGFDRAVEHLSKYNPRDVSEHDAPGVAPLVMFLELVNVGDLIQQMVDVFYEQELIATKITDRNDFLDPVVKEKKRFEQMLDERVAAGLNKGIDVLMDEVEFICATTQATTDFNPESAAVVAGAPMGAGTAGAMAAAGQVQDIGPTRTARQVVELVSSHTKMLVGSTDKNMLDVFNQEVGLRLFTALCKHLKRQRISVEGAIKLISDTNHYYLYISTLRNPELLQYFRALRELAQIYLVGPTHAKELAAIIADVDRFSGIFRAEEVYEFAERRADWFVVRRDVERAMYGIGCLVM
ncbi:MAG: hypothetical protein M1819_003614 [Sarea resinae]|nr:MAG: hypothetical protein M1819_003614 [Sarea resinae]